MTYGLMFELKGNISSEHARIKGALESKGFGVYPVPVTIEHTSYVVVLFEGAFSTAPKWAMDIGVPLYVYEREPTGGRFDTQYMRRVGHNGFQYMRYAGKGAVEHPGVGTCARCGETSNDGHTDMQGRFFCNECTDGWEACSFCGIRYDTSRLQTIDERKVCPSCMMSMVATCANADCGAVHTKGNMMTMDGLPVCKKCAKDETFAPRCRHCGNRHVRSVMRYDGDIYLCATCVGGYTTCGCGKFINKRESNKHNRDELEGKLWCGKCDFGGRKFFGAYNYVPKELTYYRTSDADKSTLFGMEIEMCGGDRMKTLAVWKDVPQIWCKKDGSLDPINGLEMVTQPCSYNYFMTTFPWEKLLRSCIKNKYVSHNDERCGLHIHIEKKAFGETTDEQDTNVLRVAWVMNSFWKQFVRFSRRTEKSLDRYSKRYGDLVDGEAPGAKHIEKMKYHAKQNKYMCLNLVHTDTVEIRIFRGSLNLETLLASLQLCNVFVGLKELSLMDIYSMTWRDFYDRCTGYPELMSYMGRRQLTRNSCGTSSVPEIENEEQVEITVHSLNSLLGRSPARFVDHIEDEADVKAADPLFDFMNRAM